MIFSHHVDCLQLEFHERFGDLKSQEAIFSIFSSPFLSNIEDAPAPLQMELIEVQEDLKMKAIFQDVALQIFYSKSL